MATPLLADDAPELTELSAKEVLDFAQAIPPEDITIIDATSLTLEELMALSRAERENPTRLQCCDWGGSCLPHAPES